jgi:hypothetical protein
MSMSEHIYLYTDRIINNDLKHATIYIRYILHVHGILYYYILYIHYIYIHTTYMLIYMRLLHVYSIFI